MTLSPRDTTFVLPFYLKLMRQNATWIGEVVWDQLVEVGRTATLDDVLWLLQLGLGVLLSWEPG